MFERIECCVGCEVVGIQGQAGGMRSCDDAEVGPESIGIWLLGPWTPARCGLCASGHRAGARSLFGGLHFLTTPFN